MIGQTLSHYRILEKLGEGGMGVVYKGQDLKLDRIVALKFLPAHTKVSPSEQDRFLQEAKTVSSINHPNVCTIHAVEEHEGQRFIVMEYVDGQPLSAFIEKGPLPFKQVVDFALQTAEALYDAHSKGIVHRDIKSDNIMVNSRNQVKVMDFGLAKLKGAMKLTRTSSTVGTLAYMAPEQIQGGEVDARSDIFSFGVLFFEMLTKHLPFRGEHEAAMVYSIVNEEPEPIEKYRSDVPAELTHIISRTLEKDPADRYQSMGEIVGELRHQKKQSSRVFRRPPTDRLQTTIPESTATQDVTQAVVSPEGMKRWINKYTVGIGSLLVVAVVALLLLVGRGGESAGPMVTKLLKVPSSNANFPNISQDGNWIVFVAEDAKRIQNLYMVHTTGGEPKRVTNDTIFTVKQMPCFSADASQIVYEQRPPFPPELYIVSALGGTPRRLLGDGSLPMWSPDGKRIAFFRIRFGKAMELRTVNPDGKEEVLVASIPVPQGVFFYNVAWSPDSRRLAFLKNFQSPSKERYSEIFVHDIEDSTEKQITFDKKLIDDFCWTSTGEIVYNSTRGGDVDLWIIPEEGGTPKQLTLGAGADRVPRVSKDAKRMVYVNESETSNLWTLDLQTKQFQQLTFEDLRIVLPVYSRDGTKLVYWRVNLFEVANAGFVVCNKDGSDPAKTAPTFEDYTFTSAAPGRWTTGDKGVILGATRRDTVRKNPDSLITRTSFFEHELATNNTRKILDGVLLDISRDDQYILYRRDQDTLFWRGVLARKAAPDKIIREIESRWGPAQFTWDSKQVIAHDSARIWFTPVDEKGKPRFYKKPKNFSFVHSLPDGKAILGTIWDASARTSTLVKFTLSNGSVESLVALPPASEIWTWGSSVSPDGKTLLFTRQETKNRIVLLENFR